MKKRNKIVLSVFLSIPIIILILIKTCERNVPYEHNHLVFIDNYTTVKESMINIMKLLDTLHIKHVCSRSNFISIFNKMIYINGFGYKVNLSCPEYDEIDSIFKKMVFILIIS